MEIVDRRIITILESRSTRRQLYKLTRRTEAMRRGFWFGFGFRFRRVAHGTHVLYLHRRRTLLSAARGRLRGASVLCSWPLILCRLLCDQLQTVRTERVTAFQQSHIFVFLVTRDTFLRLFWSTLPAFDGRPGAALGPDGPGWHSGLCLSLDSYMFMDTDIFTIFCNVFKCYLITSSIFLFHVSNK